APPWTIFYCKKTRFVTACAQDISQPSATGKKNDCPVIFDNGKRRFKTNKKIFCVEKNRIKGVFKNFF
ncbi:hypothetical protein, partial [Escherichia coli]|uniref:hypothetical protein n=1 Tax=Escherichia coli TaxID=562 RepID=UPI001BAE826C